jgi:uncharacterized protein (DUF433 family)
MSIFVGNSKTNDIIELWHKGLTDKEISKHCRVSLEAVEDVLSEYFEDIHEDDRLYKKAGFK